MRGYLLMGTRATDGGGRKNHGKPASPPTELGANKTSYASAKIGALTLILIAPTNKQLLDPALDKDSHLAERFLLPMNSFRGSMR